MKSGSRLSAELVNLLLLWSGCTSFVHYFLWWCLGRECGCRKRMWLNRSCMYSPNYIHLPSPGPVNPDMSLGWHTHWCFLFYFLHLRLHRKRPRWDKSGIQNWSQISVSGCAVMESHRTSPIQVCFCKRTLKKVTLIHSVKKYVFSCTMWVKCL